MDKKITDVSCNSNAGEPSRREAIESAFKVAKYIAPATLVLFSHPASFISAG